MDKWLKKEEKKNKETQWNVTQCTQQQKNKIIQWINKLHFKKISEKKNYGSNQGNSLFHFAFQ